MVTYRSLVLMCIHCRYKCVNLNPGRNSVQGHLQLQASAMTSKSLFLHFVAHLPCRKYHQSRFKHFGMSISKYQSTRRNIPEDLNRQERCENLKCFIGQINHVCHNQTHIQHSVLVNGTGCLFHSRNGHGSFSHRNPASTGTTCDRHQ
jgi:hypothetical protein